MENITIQDILEATDGTLLCGDPSMKIDHLSTNSMEIGPNTLFVPIIGERVDAHIFIPNALKEGGACLTQEHTEASGNAPYIKVPDTLTAMQQIVPSLDLEIFPLRSCSSVIYSIDFCRSLIGKKGAISNRSDARRNIDRFDFINILKPRRT